MKRFLALFALNFLLAVGVSAQAVNPVVIPQSAPVLNSNASRQVGKSTAHNLSQPAACNDTSGSGTAQSCNTTPTFTPAASDAIIYKTTTSNTGDLTVAINGGSAVHVRKWLGSSVLASGDLPANTPVTLIFDGTYWEALTIGNAPSGSGPGTGTQYNLTSWATTNTLGSTPVNITGQIPTGVNGAAPVSTSPALGGRTVSGTSDTILCDSTTALRDRGTTIVYTDTVNVSITVPSAAATGCGSGTQGDANFAFAVLIAAPSGTATYTFTPSTSTLTIIDGSSVTSGATSLVLSNGQFATFNSIDNVNYEVRVSDGKAATAAALATTPSQCTGSNFATGITASGNANCSTPSSASSTPVNLTSTTASANSTSAQQLQEVAIPSAFFNLANASFGLETSGYFTTPTGQTPTFTLAHKLCTVSGCGSGTVITLDTYTSGASTAVSTDAPWRHTSTIGTTIAGTSGQLEVNGDFCVGLGTTAATAKSCYGDNNTGLSSAINLSGALYLDTFATFSTNGATSNAAIQKITRLTSGTPPGAISASVSPSTASVNTLATQAFTVTMTNDFGGQGVTWALSGSGCSGSTCGTLSSVTTTSVTYTGPSSVPSPATVILTATSIADTTKTSIATITVTGGSGPTVSQKSGPCTISISATCTFGSGVPAGHTIAVIVQAANQTVGGGNCFATSTPSNTWVIPAGATSANSGGGLTFGIYALSAASGTNSVVVTCSTSGVIGAAAYDITGCASTCVFDASGNNTGSGTTVSVVTSGSVSSSTEYVLAVGCDWNTFRTWTAGSGYTIEDRFYTGGGGTYTCATEDNNTRTGLSGAQTATLTSTAGTTWSSAIMTFK